MNFDISTMNLSDIHKLMVRNVFLNIELLINEEIEDICEYDIQALMYLFFRKIFNNSDYIIGREKEKKFDCVIYKGKEPIVYYELKTYHKKHEKIKQPVIDNDLCKLAYVLNKNKGAKSYFILSCSKSIYKKFKSNELKFIIDHYNDDKKWIDYKTSSGESIRLRPSVKQNKGRSVVFSWEVK